MNEHTWSYKLNSPYVKSLEKEVQRTKRNERAIINALIKEALARGYFLRSVDGEGDLSPITKQKKLIEPNLYSCDDARLWVIEQVTEGNTTKFRRVCSFYFIYGNGNFGCDVISDGSWVDDGKRNTSAIYDAIDAAGSAVAEKLEKQL